MPNQDLSNTLLTEVKRLQDKIDKHQLPSGLKDKVEEMIQNLNRAAKFGSYSEEYERTSHYIDWITKIPWNNRTQDQINLQQARQVLDKHHYGLEPVKQRMLEYLSIVKLNKQQLDQGGIAKAPILCLVGLAGTGKTTFAYALAEAMGRKIARIPFGGLGSARDLRGQSRLHLEAEPGYVVKALTSTETINPIILLDEIDRVAAEARADVMGVLLALLDPGQNKAFIDHYIDFPINLNEVLFIGTANNTDNLSTAVANRLEIIHMPTYSDEEKIIIAKNYVLPGSLVEAGLKPDTVTITEETWPLIVRPIGYDSGIRILKRTVDAMVRKVAFQVVNGEIDKITITPDNMKQYIDTYI